MTTSTRSTTFRKFSVHTIENVCNLDSFQAIKTEKVAKVVKGGLLHRAHAHPERAKSHPHVCVTGTVLASKGAALELRGCIPNALHRRGKSGLATVAETYAAVADKDVRKIFQEILQRKNIIASWSGGVSTLTFPAAKNSCC